MKFLLSKIFLFLLATNLFSQVSSSKYHVEHYSSGTIKALYTLNKKGFEVNLFHPNGQLSEAGKFKNNKRHKTWTRWNENGQKTSVANFKNGKKKGKWFVWHTNGNILLVIKYKNNRVTSSKQWDKFGTFIKNDNFANSQ